MSTVLAEQTTAVPTAEAAREAKTRRLMFWISRYLPAEIAGTAAMVVAGLAVTTWTESPAIVALAALIGEFAGFYAVLAVTVYVEQRLRAGETESRGRSIVRTALLLIAEFGASEVLDTLLIRPAALIAGVWLFGPLWGMLAGKIVADVIFYAIAAGAFTITVKAGLREGRSRREVPV